MISAQKGPAGGNVEDVDDTYSEVDRESLIRTRPLVTLRRERSSTGHRRGRLLGGVPRSVPTSSSLFLSLPFLPLSVRETTSWEILLARTRSLGVTGHDGRDDGHERHFRG